MLESLHQHRVLTARQIHALHTPDASLRWAQRILTRLHKRGLTEHAAGPHGLALWFLTAPGAETIQAAGTLAEPRRRLTTPAQAAGPLRAHTLAVNDTGIAFVQAAREHAGDSCGSLSWRHEIAHPYTAGRGRHGAHLLIADALLSYLQAAPDDSLILHQRFIELDRGTIPPDQLASKLARYAQLRHYTTTKDAPRGAAVAGLLPHVSPGARGARRPNTSSGAKARAEDDRALPLRPLTSPLRDRTHRLHGAPQLTARGPFAPIFIPAEQPDHYTDWLDNTQDKPPER